MALSYFIAGVVTGVAASFVVRRLRHNARLFLPRRWYLSAGALVGSFAIVAALMYLAIEVRHPPQRMLSEGAAAGTAAMTSAARDAGVSAAPGAAPPAGSAAAKSMQDAVAGLEARLARGGGSSDDWTLLGQAYEILGRAEDARRARAHTISPGPVGPVSQMSAAALAAVASATESTSAPAAPGARTPEATAAALAQRVTASPRDAQGWLALANLRRAQRDYAGARDAFAHAAELNAMSAQSWADYADTLGTLADGSLTGEAGRAIDRALALDAANPKALWLKASQAHEQRRFADALLWWQKLHALLPADSPDAQIVAGNIAEDTALAGQAPAVASRGSSAVSGTVSLDARFASRVPRDSTLFIYAKAADASGPPLAVLRTTASAWPVNFRLDDSMAMIPSRRLSQFDKVVVEARISRSGQATPAAGDLYVTSPVLRPAAGKKLVLVIDREIG
jgi:cytochrome c-type biogenesis protein CcmH